MPGRPHPTRAARQSVYSRIKIFNQWRNCMAFDFNASDIFEMAKEIERNGASFYSTAAQKVDDEQHRSMLLELAKME